MPRAANPEPWHPWKIVLPASLAGAVEFLLLDPIHGKPLYGSRNTLLTILLRQWINSLPPEVRNQPGGGIPFLHHFEASND